MRTKKKKKNVRKAVGKGRTFCAKSRINYSQDIWIVYLCNKVMVRALSGPDQPTSPGEPINELVASICQVVAPTPPNLNDRFEFLFATRER